MMHHGQWKLDLEIDADVIHANLLVERAEGRLDLHVGAPSCTDLISIEMLTHIASFDGAQHRG